MRKTLRQSLIELLLQPRSEKELDSFVEEECICNDCRAELEEREDFPEDDWTPEDLFCGECGEEAYSCECRDEEEGLPACEATECLARPSFTYGEFIQETDVRIGEHATVNISTFSEGTLVLIVPEDPSLSPYRQFFPKEG